MSEHPLIASHLADEKRMRLISDLEEIRERFARTNQRFDFAAIRDGYPSAARIFFRGQDLRFVNLRNADLRFIDFRGADLTGCVFDGARIVGARFELAKVSRDALRTARDWDDYEATWEPAGPTDQVEFLRRPLERFSFSPRLPELVILPDDPIFRDDDTGLSVEDAGYLAEGRLAIAITCLDHRDWTRVVLDTPALPSHGEAIALRSYEAVSYCAELSARAGEFGLPSGTKIGIPGYGLMRKLALARPSPDERRPTAVCVDFTLSALAVGTNSREFVERYKAGQSMLASAGLDLPQDISLGRFTLSEGHGRAKRRLRPLFRLGSIER